MTAAYTRYGLAVGEAFQLCDDLLGVYGDPATTGKPAGDDLRTGKPTALLMLARQLATPAQRRALDGAGAEAGEREVARLAELVADTGAVAAVETDDRRPGGRGAGRAGHAAPIDRDRAHRADRSRHRRHAPAGMMSRLLQEVVTCAP